jgi:DNA-binding winged helix-turn-helix (wHTH) protein
MAYTEEQIVNNLKAHIWIVRNGFNDSELKDPHYGAVRTVRGIGYLAVSHL